MTKKKKLWIASYHLYPTWSGAGERFLRYNEGLTNRGLDVSYFSSMVEGSPKQEKYKGTIITRIDNNKKTPTYKQFIDKIAEIALAEKEKPDAIIILIASYFNVGSIRKLSKNNIKVIYVNTMMFQISNSKFFLKRWISKKLNLRLLEAFDLIVSSTSYLKEPIVKLGIEAKKVEVISNGVDLNRFKPSSSEIEKEGIIEKLKLPKNEFIFLYVGLKVERKGVLELIEYWQKYKEEGGKGTLLIVGDEQRSNPLFSEFYIKWDERLQTIKNKHNIILHSATNEIELYFKVSRAFVFLSKTEGLGNVLIEAMASECPVITTEFNGFSFHEEKESKAIITIKKNYEEFAKAVESLTKEEKLYQEIKKNALQMVINRHSLTTTLDKYVNIV